MLMLFPFSGKSDSYHHQVQLLASNSATKSIYDFFFLLLILLPWVPPPLKPGSPYLKSAWASRVFATVRCSLLVPPLPETGVGWNRALRSVGRLSTLAAETSGDDVDYRQMLLYPRAHLFSISRNLVCRMRFVTWQ